MGTRRDQAISLESLSRNSDDDSDETLMIDEEEVTVLESEVYDSELISEEVRGKLILLFVFDRKIDIVTGKLEVKKMWFTNMLVRFPICFALVFMLPMVLYCC